MRTWHAHRGMDILWEAPDIASNIRLFSAQKNDLLVTRHRQFDFGGLKPVKPMQGLYLLPANNHC